MATWIERASGPLGPTWAMVSLELVVALTLLATVLHFRSLGRTRPELRAVRIYFLFFFLFALAAPLLTIALTSPDPRGFLAAAGLTFGRAGRGLALTAVGLPLTVLSGLLGSRDPAMRKMYPFAKAVLDDGRAFLRYELSYLVLYYLPWEFVFRGVLFLPLVPVVGLIPALAIQTTISTLLHIGHPPTEVFAAAGAGIVFGAVAWLTGSFLYTWALHAAAGMATDTFLFLGQRSERP